MSSQVGSVLDSLRRPEYTGENRCVPCTVVNVAIAVAIAAAIAIVTVELAVAAFLLALGLIYLRGYLVPGTPELTKRYLPERVMRRFDPHPAAEEPATTPGGAPTDPADFETVKKKRYLLENRVDPEEFLLEAGVIEVDEEIDDIRLTVDFLDRLDRHVRDIDAVGPADVAELFDVEPADVADEGRDYPAFTVGTRVQRVRKWPSATALRADLAGERAVREVSDAWLDVPLEQRVKMRETLRSLREYCIACGGDIVFTEDTVESCCGTWQVFAVKCDSCDEHFVEIDPSKVEDGPFDHGLTPD